MKRFRKQVAFIVVIVVAMSFFTPIRASAADVGGRAISSQGACVIDFETGLVIYGYREDTQRVPASMTKMAAVYVIYDAIKAGEISLDTTTRISRGVSVLSVNWEYSNVPLNEGWSVTIRDLLDIVIIWSACAATVALGEALCGSESALVARMNEKMASLGIDARFYDSYGVSASNSISPKGMAMLTRSLLLEHPEVLQVTSKRSVTFRGTEYRNTNLLLGDYSGADGVKTGFTNAAGFCFTGTAIRDGRRIIAVTMGSTSASRFPDTRILLDYGFANAESVIAENNKEDDPEDIAEDIAEEIPEDIAEEIPEDIPEETPEDDPENNTENNTENNRSGRASPTGADLILNGETLPLSAYLIDGSHYFKLRDIAFLLRDTESRFYVTWNESSRSVEILSGVPYTLTADLTRDLGSETIQCELSKSKFFIDDVEYSLEAYMIDGNNYFKLRDLAPIFDFEVGWIEETRSVTIDTSIDEAA